MFLKLLERQLKDGVSCTFFYGYDAPLISLAYPWADVVLTSTKSASSDTFLNYIYIKITQTIKPLQAYNLVTFIKELLIYLLILEGKCSAVHNIISIDRVFRNTMPFTNVTPAVKVTKLQISLKSIGIRIYSISAWLEFFLTVSPYSC